MCSIGSPLPLSFGVSLSLSFKGNPLALIAHHFMGAVHMHTHTKAKRVSERYDRCLMDSQSRNESTKTLIRSMLEIDSFGGLKE